MLRTKVGLNPKFKTKITRPNNAWKKIFYTNHIAILSISFSEYTAPIRILRMSYLMSWKINDRPVQSPGVMVVYRNKEGKSLFVCIL